MPFLPFHVIMVVLTFSSSTGAAPVTDDITELRKTTELLQKEIMALKEHDKLQKLQLQEVKRENTEMKRFFNEAVNTWEQNQDITVDSMFFATISEESIPISTDEPIILGFCPDQSWRHFNTILGMYTAPVHGYYQFSVTKRANRNSGSFYFLVDEERYAVKDTTTTNSDSTPSGSTTINIELSAGQIVQIDNVESTEIFGTSNGSIGS